MGRHVAQYFGHGASLTGGPAAGVEWCGLCLSATVSRRLCDAVQPNSYFIQQFFSFSVRLSRGQKKSLFQGQHQPRLAWFRLVYARWLGNDPIYVKTGNVYGKRIFPWSPWFSVNFNQFCHTCKYHQIFSYILMHILSFAECLTFAHSNRLCCLLTTYKAFRCASFVITG